MCLPKLSEIRRKKASHMSHVHLLTWNYSYVETKMASWRTSVERQTEVSHRNLQVLIGIGSSKCPQISTEVSFSFIARVDILKSRPKAQKKLNLRISSSFAS